jgi:threonine/homoserine/homoserine lactone efflux protein
MNEHLVAILPMVSFAFATAASPGPVNIIAAMSGAQFGVKKSLSYVVGAAAAFVAVLLCVGIGLGSVLVSNRLMTNGFAIAGAIYMLYLSFRLATSKSNDTGDNTAPPPRVMSGAIAQCLNPKAWIICISAISIYVVNSKDYTLYLSIFCAIFFVVCFFSILGWVIVGSKASSTLNGNYSVFNKVMAGLLALSVIYFIVDFVVLGRA